MAGEEGGGGGGLELEYIFSYFQRCVKYPESFKACLNEGETSAKKAKFFHASKA